MTTPTQLTIPDFAAHIGCKRNYGYQLRNEGRLVMAADGKHVLVAESIARIAATRDPSKAGVAARHADARGTAVQTGHAAAPASAQASATVAQDGGVGGSYQAARAVKERYLALEAKRAYELACGQLVRVEDVAAVVSDAATTFRHRLESLPDQLAAQLGGHLDETQRRAIAAEIIESILAGLAADFAKLKENHALA